jgi:hypothetical protein
LPGRTLLAEKGWTDTQSLAFFAVPVGDGEAVGVAVGLLLGDGLVLEVGLSLGVGLSPELGEVADLPGDGDWVADLLGDALGLGLGVTVGVTLGVAVTLGLLLATVMLVKYADVTRPAAVLAAAFRLGVAATVVAGRVAHAAVTIGGWVPRVAATASPNIPLLISRMPARVPNVAILPGRSFTGLASAPPSGRRLLWSPQLPTLCITEWAFPTVPIRHLRCQRCQGRRDDVGK